MEFEFSIMGVAGDGTAINVGASDAFTECVAMGTRSLWVNRSLEKFMSGQAKELSEHAAGNSDEDAKWAMLMHLRDAAGTVSAIRERGEFLERRLDHAVKRLKSKGLYAPSMEDLDRLCAEKNLIKARGLIQVVRCAMGEAVFSVGSQDTLDETSWKLGIEFALSQHDPDLFASDAMFGRCLDDMYPYIAMNTLLAAYGAKLNTLLESDDYIGEIQSVIIDKYLSHPKVAADVLEWADKLLRSGEDEQAKRISGLEKALADEKEKSQSLAQKLETAEKAARPNRNAGQRLLDKIQSLERQLEGLSGESDAKIRAYQDALDQRDRLISDLSAQTPPPDEGLPSLPDGNIVFVGGHPNMVKKIRELHPGWTFVDGGDKGFSEFRDPRAIFFWDRHMAHPVWQRAMRLAGPGTPKIYLKATNPELLELEMARGWAAAQKRAGEAPDEA